MPTSIYDIMYQQRIWTFHGALLPPLPPLDYQKAYPSVGLTCEVFLKNDGTDGILTVPEQEFYSWTGPDQHQVNHHKTSTRVRKALRLRMKEPATYQTHLSLNYPAKFPDQGPMCESLRCGIEKNLLFVEHGDIMISNQLAVCDMEINNGADLTVFYVIRLVGGPDKWGITISGYWSDGYLGTGGWC